MNDDNETLSVGTVVVVSVVVNDNVDKDESGCFLLFNTTGGTFDVDSFLRSVCCQ